VTPTRDTGPARPVRYLATAVLLALALVIAWRAIVAAMHAGGDTEWASDLDPAASKQATHAVERAWRDRLAHAPYDVVALVMLARVSEARGDVAQARAAMDEAVRQAPADRQTLLEAAAFHLRAGEAPPAMALLRRVADLYPEARSGLWPTMAAGIDDRSLYEFFAGVARDDPEWWPEFADYACAKARDAGALQRFLTVRAAAGTATARERRCIVGRLQREGRWPSAYQAWLNSLPSAQRQRIGYVFNGDFELPLSDLGFDWTVSAQEAVTVETQPVEGAGGRRALKVEFRNKRWGGPPVQQYLMLEAGRFRFEGRGRADALQTWLGLQWGLYCLPQGTRAPRQLVRSGRFAGNSGWNPWQVDFRVPDDCPVQVLRLELANPRRDADTPGDVAVRLDGTLRFDDLRVRRLD